ncbi:MAG: hypothetical protein AAF799_21070 [Myxococcota bacterium]
MVMVRVGLLLSLSIWGTACDPEAQAQDGALGWRNGTSTSTGTSTSSGTSSTSTSTSTSTGDGGGSFIEPDEDIDPIPFEVTPFGILDVHHGPATAPDPSQTCCEITCNTGETFCIEDDRACACDNEAHLDCFAIGNGGCETATERTGCVCADFNIQGEVRECYQDCGGLETEREFIERPAPGELVPVEQLCERACDDAVDNGRIHCGVFGAIAPYCTGICQNTGNGCVVADADVSCDVDQCYAGIDDEGPYCSCPAVFDCQCGCSL